MKEPLFTEWDWYVVGRKTREDCRLLLFMIPLLTLGCGRIAFVSVERGLQFLPPRPPHLAQPGVYVKPLQDVLAAHASDLARIAAGCRRRLSHLRRRDGRVAAALRCRLGKTRVASCVGGLLVLDCTGQREIRGQAVRLGQAHECGFLRAARGRAARLIVRLAWHRVWLVVSEFFEERMELWELLELLELLTTHIAHGRPRNWILW